MICNKTKRLPDLQMGKTPSPQIIPSRQRKQSSNFQHRHTTTTGNTPNKSLQKTQPAPNFIKAAAKKLARFFTFFFVKKAPIPDSRRNNSQVKGISFSTDISTGSNSKSQSKYKYSTSSYNSSTSESGQIGTANFTIEEIYKATDKFSPTNVIGEGGFGTVYKGRLKNGTIVAIKRAKKNVQDKRLSAEFKNEILTLSQIEHQNLVRLFGFLEHGDERIILVEYVGNGTLREHLNGTQGNGLEVADRLDIAIDIAHAITYLHMYTEPPIIHRDIKASNILITEKLRAKVADFGLARMAAEDPAATHISTQVKGTAGYLDPEYLKTYQLTEKSDVYSFGVLLVELVTGRHPIQPKRPLKERATIKWAMHKLKDGDTVLVMDPMIRRTPASNMAVEKVLKLARQCLAPTRQARPSMKHCAEVLWGIRKDFKDKAFISSTTAANSHQSENLLVKNAKKNLHKSFGIEEDSDNYRFKSA